MNPNTHRPWPPPKEPWIWRQRWCDLLFAHWKVDADLLRPLIPASLAIDCYQGATYLAIVPFMMRAVRLRGLPPIPGFSTFPEINVRIYVTDGQHPGVWFLSLDATHPLAVWCARRLFHLPYFRASIDAVHRNNQYHYSCQRRTDPDYAFSAAYEPNGPVFQAQPGSLEHWLTERYCLYVVHPRKGLCWSQVHHDPWPLQAASVTITKNQLAPQMNLDLSDSPDSVLFSKNLDVKMWPLRSVLAT